MDDARVEALLSLLHWVAGVSYFKMAVPPIVGFESGRPEAATARLLEALYSDGLGEFSYANRLPVPRGRFATGNDPAGDAVVSDGVVPSRALVLVGGGKDSAVAVEVIRASGLPFALFSVGETPAMARTAEAAGKELLVARRRIDPSVPALNRVGALNGHVPITAIVASAALLTAALNGFDAVVLANERSASQGNGVEWDGIEVNHQFSKSMQAERLLRAALWERDPRLSVFSILRPASELAIARAFARMPKYHHAFTSCNSIFKLDLTLRRTSWCCDCPKCRFVYLVLAPFMTPQQLSGIFGCDMLQDESQYEGFALLAASGGHKPFECVGEEEESLAAIELLSDDSRWSEHAVVRRLVREVLPAHPSGRPPGEILGLAGEHAVPATFLPALREILGA